MCYRAGWCSHVHSQHVPLQTTVSTFFKTTTIPVPKRSPVPCLKSGWSLCSMPTALIEVPRTPQQLLGVQRTISPLKQRRLRKWSWTWEKKGELIGPVGLRWIQESTTAAVDPEEAEEIWHSTQDPPSTAASLRSSCICLTIPGCSLNYLARGNPLESKSAQWFIFLGQVLLWGTAPMCCTM